MRAILNRTLGIVCAGILSSTAVSSTPVDPPLRMEIPQAVLKTPEDIQEGKRLTEIMELISTRYWRPISGKEIFQRMMGENGGIEGLDPHTKILSPKESARMRERMENREFGGLGVQIGRTPEYMTPQGILVVEPRDDTPASRAGLQPDDVIIEVITLEEDGTVDEVHSAINMPTEKAVELLTGDVDTSVAITVWRDGVVLPRITLVRKLIRVTPVHAELKDDQIGYVRITSFGYSVHKEVTKAITALEEENNDRPLKGLVLDMRNNPGGSLFAANVTVFNFLHKDRYDGMGNDTFTFKGKEDHTVPAASVVLSIETRGKIYPYAHGASSRDIMHGAPILILVNDRCASGCEIVAGILQKHGRATVASVDERTFGKGTVQTLLPLGHKGSAGTLRLTTSQYLIGSLGCEQPIQGVGIQPDILLKRTGDDPPPSGNREEALEGSIATSTVSSSDCQYEFAVPDDHKKAALHMLSIMEREPR